MKELAVSLTLEEYGHLIAGRKRIEEELIEARQAIERTTDEMSRALEQTALQSYEISQLRWEIENLKRRLWGKSSEKRNLPQDPCQLSICFESPTDVADPVGEEVKSVEKATKEEQKYNRFRKSFTKKIPSPMLVSPLMRAFAGNRLSYRCLMGLI